MTLNLWSCGLDPQLQTWHTTHDKHTRESLISYAINDIFAPTHLYFSLNESNISDPAPRSTPDLNSIMDTSSIPSIQAPFFLIIADSHGKNLDPIITESHYRIITHSISGLQWSNSNNHRLCTRSLILESSFNSLISSCIGIMFIVGTNSVRNTHASEILAQIQDIIFLLRNQHTHLTGKFRISIVNTFPCYKGSAYFPSLSNLTSNIQTYNELLRTASQPLNFSCVNLQVLDEHLSTDQMHIHHRFKTFVCNSIIEYFNIVFTKQQKHSQSNRRSRQAITGRNRKRHNQLKLKVQQYTLTRTIHPIWDLKIAKSFLKYHAIHYHRLSDVRHHKVHIQFTNTIRQHHAENYLPLDVFNQSNYHEWLKRTTQ
jgi:hypothetical protein